MKKGCVVGIGAIGPIHADALQKENRLYGICDVKPERLSSFAPENTNIKRFSSFNAVCRDPLVDTVHICTPHYLHKEMTIQALKAGKHVVLEKPAAISFDQLNELAFAEQNTDKKICIMLQNRTNPSVCLLHQLLKNPKQEWGKLCGITGFLTWQRTPQYYQHDDWRGRWETEGGGVMINQAVHLFDLICYLGGPVSAITATISNKYLHQIEVEDTADAILEMSSGVHACFYATNTYTTNSPVRLEFEFENILFRYADNRLYQITKDDCQILIHDDSSTPGRSYWGSGHARVIHDFYAHLEGDEIPYLSLSDAMPVMKTLLSFYKSAKEGKRIIL